MLYKSLVSIIFLLFAVRPAYAASTCQTDLLNLALPHVRGWSDAKFSYRTHDSEEHLRADVEEYSPRSKIFSVRVYNEIHDGDGWRESSIFFLKIDTVKKYVGMMNIETGKVSYLLDVDKELYKNYVSKCLK